MKPSVFETPTENLYYKGDHEIISLQVLKALAAFAVVLIHTHFIIGGYLSPITRNAVPLFFMITGYFLLNRNGVLTLDRLKRSTIKLLKLTIIAQCFYAATICIPHPDQFVQLMTNPRHIWGLLVGGATFNCSFWYLNAIVQALIFLYLVVRLKLGRFLPFIVVLALFLNLFLGDYALFWSNERLPLPIHRNFFTIGIPSIYLGMCIRRYEHKILISFTQLTKLTILLYILLYVECFFILHRQQWGDVFFFTIPTTICTFIWFLRSASVNKFSKLASIGRKDSSNIFILHIFVMRLLFKFHLTNATYEWVAVSLVSLLLSIALRKSQSLLKIGVAKLKSR
jgi:surface polysaccharide O-acyltransferase-like enzyme